MLNIPPPETIWKIAALGFGLIVSIAVIFIMHFINYSLYPTPEILPEHFEMYSDFIKENPVFLAGNLLGSAAGSFTGGAIAFLIRHDIRPVHTLFPGVILMILGFINIIITPHPPWFWIASLFVYLPPCWFGAYFFQQKLNS